MHFSCLYGNQSTLSEFKPARIPCQGSTSRIVMQCKMYNRFLSCRQHICYLKFLHLYTVVYWAMEVPPYFRECRLFCIMVYSTHINKWCTEPFGICQRHGTLKICGSGRNYFSTLLVDALCHNITLHKYPVYSVIIHIYTYMYVCVCVLLGSFY